MERIHDHDVVALVVDLPGTPFRAGDVGTVVFTHADGEAFEVEFANADSRPRFVVETVQVSQLLRLRNLQTRVSA